MISIFAAVSSITGNMLPRIHRYENYQDKNSAPSGDRKYD
jgi:hypothetical protein